MWYFIMLTPVQRATGDKRREQGGLWSFGRDFARDYATPGVVVTFDGGDGVASILRRRLPPASCHSVAQVWRTPISLGERLRCIGVGRRRHGGREILSLWPCTDATKIEVDPMPFENWEMAGEPFPETPESPPLEYFLSVPLLQCVLFAIFVIFFVFV